MFNLSVFEIIGPPMIGPSSSHTAGACRIGWTARAVLGQPPVRADFQLHGSFLATGAGHGTHEALVAGILGFEPDCEELKNSLEIAKSAGVSISFGEIDLGPQAHPNSVRVQLSGDSASLSLTACSIGGGSIRIQELDGFPAALSGTLAALIIWHLDTPGFLARVTAVLACVELNVAAIRTSRRERGAEALTVIEIDGKFPPEALALLDAMPAVSRLSTLPLLPGL
jgi:L-serine dehydratase